MNGGLTGSSVAMSSMAEGALAGETPLAQLTGIRKHYDVGLHRLEVLKGVDLAIERGQLTVIMGPSGSGKSTLLHILGGLERPSEGRVVYRGADISRLDDDALSALRSREIGFIFQAFHLIPRLSLLENVEVPLLYVSVSATEARARALRSIAAVGLSARLDHGPTALSGGERQRVAIARALVNDPALVLADEPTGNLDARTGHEIMAILRGLARRGKALVIVTHNPEVAEHADRVLTMKDGWLTI